MYTFSSYLLLENYKNLFEPNEKIVWADQVWEILQQSYKRIGGIKGSGFENKQSMISKIPMWKLYVKGDKVKVAIMYKDKNGRKVVAVGTDGSNESRLWLVNTLSHEFERSYGEYSGPLYSFIKNIFGDQLRKYLIPVKQAEELLSKKLTPVNDFEYTRIFNGKPIKKIMIGTPEKRIVK